MELELPIGYIVIDLFSNIGHTQVIALAATTNAATSTVHLCVNTRRGFGLIPGVFKGLIRVRPVLVTLYLDTKKVKLKKL